MGTSPYSAPAKSAGIHTRSAVLARAQAMGAPPSDTTTHIVTARATEPWGVTALTKVACTVQASVTAVGPPQSVPGELRCLRPGALLLLSPAVRCRPR